MLQNVEKSDAALLLSVIGLTNILGRMIAGIVSDRPQVCCVWVVAVALLFGGITCFCIPFSHSYYQLVIESAVFGFCMATWTSLRPLVLVELLGIENLTNSFGLLALFQGIAFCIGPPLAGLIVDYTGSYTLPFLLAGASFTLSAVICVPLPGLAAYWRKHHQDAHDLLLEINRI